MGRHGVWITLLACGILGCSGELGGSSYDDDASSDVGPTNEGGFAHDVSALEIRGVESCGDPDRPLEHLTRACSTACGAGVQTCVGHLWSECDARQPRPEACDNGVDDDCNGQTDEDCGACRPGVMRACSASEPSVGACHAGAQVCRTDRSWGPCEGAVLPTDETCNGVDDDCDGNVDEGLMRVCAAACGNGMQTCGGGAWSACVGRAPSAETCNNIDDDCNGSVDEDLARACSTACGGGVQRCAAGAWSTCVVGTPVSETCNGVDDDCDGFVDEGVTRACRSPCGSGTETCNRGVWGGCTAPQPAAEVCDLRDNNCDGRVDEGLLASITFTNTCRYSRVFVSFGACNVCRSTCYGYWVDPGRAYAYLAAQNACFSFSAFARTRFGDECLVNRGATYDGEVHRYCNDDCRPDPSMTFSCNAE